MIKDIANNTCDSNISQSPYYNKVLLILLCLIISQLDLFEVLAMPHYYFDKDYEN